MVASTVFELADEIHRSPDGCLILSDHQIAENEWAVIHEAISKNHVVLQTQSSDFDVHYLTLTDSGRQEFHLPAYVPERRSGFIAGWLQKLFGRRSAT